MKFGGVAAVAAGLMLTGCAGGSASPDVSTTTVTETVTETTEPRPEETASPAAAPDGLTLGKEVALEAVTLTVSEVKKASSPYSQVPADQQWWAVMVEGCAAVDDVRFTWHPWSITGDDGGTYPASDSTWSDFPRPQYPFHGDRVVPNGKCTKGWMMIALNAGVEPASVDYANGIGETASWSP